MNYLDLFSGIGGFSLGFQQAGWKFDKHYFSEIDKHATKIYKKHFPNAVELGDIKGIRGETLGKIDLITFGFPCQDLSIAGKRAGLGGSRSGLFFEAVRLVRECKPSIFIFENAAGLLTSNEGQDFEIVLREIADTRLYECEWQLLNTSWFLPQNRERVYFIGHLGGTGGCKIFPIGETSRKDHIVHEGNYSGSVKMGFGSLTNDATYVSLTERRTDEAKRIRRENKNRDFSPRRAKQLEPRTDNMANNLTANFSVEQLLMVKIPEATVQGYAVAEEGEDMCTLSSSRTEGKINIIVDMKAVYPNTTRGKAIKDNNIIPCLDHNCNIAIGNEKKIRRLTPTECCRLQGFPDDWLDGIPESAKYKCLGNAVSVPVVKAIADRLKTKESEICSD